MEWKAQNRNASRCSKTGKRWSAINSSLDITVGIYFKLKHFLFWPNNSTQVENSWRHITFELKDLVDKIGVRYDGGKYCFIYQNDYNQMMFPNLSPNNSANKICGDDLLNISTLNTIHHGRCYTFEFQQGTKFFGKLLDSWKI